MTIAHNNHSPQKDQDTADRRRRQEQQKHQRKLLHDNNRELDKFKQAVDATFDMVVITDPNGIVNYANDSCERITGYKSKEVVGQKAGILWRYGMPPEYYKRLWRTIKQEKKTFEDDITNRRKNGEVYDARITVSPILDKRGNILFFVGIERDITSEKLVSRAKTEFVSLASHQLRTPPSIISWSLEALMDDKTINFSQEQQVLLEGMARANRRMIRLINVLLNISRMELKTFALKPEPIRIEEIARAELAELKPQIQRKKLKITTNYDAKLPAISMTRSFAEIIIENLLTNAIKYTPSGGSISLNISQTKRNIKIEVADSGCGVPASQQPYIFSKLYRADNARAIDTSGSGLGLYLVKLLVDYTKGKVWFKSRENKGATFWVTLPLAGVKPKSGTSYIVYDRRSDSWPPVS